MIAALAQFHFLRPWWLLLLVLWPPLLWWLMRNGGARAALARLVDAALLPHVIETAGRRRRGLWLLPALAALLVTLALAGPAWQRLPQSLYGDHAAQVVALSLSQRMLAPDVSPDRLTLARYKVRDLMAANKDGRNGLIAYAGQSFVVAPLTTDVHALTALLRALKPDVMPVPGDRPETAIAMGVGLLTEGGTGGGSLVLVTGEADRAAVAAARRAREAGVRVSVLGVGTSRGAPVQLPDGDFLKDAGGHTVVARRDEASLRAVAAAGGGRYMAMSADRTDIRVLTDELGPHLRGRRVTGAQADHWRDFGPWLLLPLLLLAALAFRRGWLLAVPFLLAPLWPAGGHAAGLPPSPVSASPAGVEVRPASTGNDIGWRDRLSALWLNDDQRAQRALSRGDAMRAEALASDPALRGTAAYRAGDYKTAAKAFTRVPGSDGAYDRGNALARMGRYREAIEAYSRALALNPHNGDAMANRQAVEDWLHEQQRELRRYGRKQANSSSGAAADQKQAQNSFRSNIKGQQNSSSSVPPMKGPSTVSQRVETMGAQSAPGGRALGPLTARHQQEEAQRAREALKARMDRELARQQSSSKPYELGRVPSSEGSSGQLPPLMKRQLDRVPDDPGGLLRRKFALEYALRKMTGGGSSR